MAELSEMKGRDFEEAVARALRTLGLHAERIEETQGESDVLASATYCEEPFGVVVECQAKEGSGQVGADKIGQVRSHFSRYLSRFGYAAKVFRCVVGRPMFSADCIKDSKAAAGSAADVGVCLMTSKDLQSLVQLNEIVPISHEDMRNIFSRDGEVSQLVKQIESNQNQLLACYGTVLAVVEMETRESGKNIVRMDERKLIGQVTALLRVQGYGKVTDRMVSRAIVDLSGPLLDLLRADDTTVRRTSHKVQDRMATLGPAQKEIVRNYFEMLKVLGVS